MYANPEANDEDIDKATELSFAKDFIEKLPKKYDTIIGENGVTLSGGEKQRLSIARAMLKKSSIILLDEATSSLDAETEAKIQDALKTLTEGIRDRHVGQQNKRLVEKWSRTGLLRGMDDVHRENMATLLENQAAQVLRESNTMSSGEVGGFTNIAFPIVRRVFGGLVANALVSIQPMSLPSGLLFYLDYTYGTDVGGANDLNSDAGTAQTAPALWLSCH